MEFKQRAFHIPFENKSDHSLEYLKGILTDVRTTTLLTVQKLSVFELDWQ